MHLRSAAVTVVLSLFLVASPAAADDAFDCSALSEERRERCMTLSTQISEDRQALAELETGVSEVLDAMVVLSDSIASSGWPVPKSLRERHETLRAQLFPQGGLDPTDAGTLETADALADVFNEFVSMFPEGAPAELQRALDATADLTNTYRQRAELLRDATALYADYRAEAETWYSLVALESELAERSGLVEELTRNLEDVARLERELELQLRYKEALELLGSGFTRLARNILSETCEIDLGCDDLLDLLIAHDRVDALAELVDTLRERCLGATAAQTTCGALGRHLDMGTVGVSAPPEEIFAILERACRKAHSTSCLMAARMLSNGEGTPTDHELRRQLLKIGCNEGDDNVIRACYLYALMLLNAEGGPADLITARFHLKRTCIAGAAQARLGCGLLGEALRDGVGGPIDKEGAYSAFSHGCASTSDSHATARACLGVGKMDALGDARPADWAAARPPLARACDLESAEACGLIGYALATGTGGPADVRRGYEAVLEGCERSDAFACHMTGAMAEDGLGRNRSLDFARQAYERACENGYEPGCSSFVRMVLQANYLPRDTAQRALQLSDRGCRAKDGVACNNLGIIHFRGYGVVRPSRDVALGFFRGGCKHGSKDACTNAENLR